MPKALVNVNSSYNHVTYTGLVCISPSGAITFVNQLYPGSISDKETVNRCGILSQDQRQRGDSIMADRGFIVSEEFEEIGVLLNIPAFLGGREQLTEAEVKERQNIASVRIHKG